MIFYNPVLKVDIGKYPAGATFDCAVMLKQKGQLQLIDHDKDGKDIIMGEHNLSLSIKDIIHEL